MNALPLIIERRACIAIPKKKNPQPDTLVGDYAR
jgi:hypothetical protein